MPKTRKKLNARAAIRSKPAEPARTTSSVGHAGWWLTVDIEVCAVCRQGYAYGAGYRCLGCDAPVCIFCIEHREGENFCPEC